MRLITLLTVFLIHFLFVTEVQAYVPPATFIESESMKLHNTLKNITLDGVVNDLRTQPETHYKESLHLDFLTGKLTATYVSDSEPLGTYEGSVKEIHRLGKFLITLSMDPSDNRFRQAMAELNIVPTEKTEVSLERIGHLTTWKWGTNPSVQFLKDEFLPTDYQSGTGQTAEEVFVAEYTSSASAIRVPKSAILKLQGKDAFRYTVKAVRVNQSNKFVANPFALKSPSAKDWVTLVR